MHDTHDQFKNLLDWYTERGLTHLPLPLNQSLPTNEVALSAYEIVFIIDDQSHSSKECRDMLTKIIAAMKVHPEDTLVIPASKWHESPIAAKAVVNLSASNITCNARHVMRASSLMQMLHEPSLKRQTWEKLQQLMAQLED